MHVFFGFFLFLAWASRNLRSKLETKFSFFLFFLASRSIRCFPVRIFSAKVWNYSSQFNLPNLVELILSFWFQLNWELDKGFVDSGQSAFFFFFKFSISKLTRLRIYASSFCFVKSSLQKNLRILVTLLIFWLLKTRQQWWVLTTF